MLVARGFMHRRLSRTRAGSSLQFAYFYPARSLRHARTRADGTRCFSHACSHNDPKSRDTRFTAERNLGRRPVYLDTTLIDVVFSGSFRLLESIH